MSLQVVKVMTCVVFVASVEICYSVLDVLKHFIQVVDLLVHSTTVNMQLLVPNFLTRRFSRSALLS